ncbi:MAG: photosystem reaction center subunit H, partial [Cyanobium sp. Prado107]|nr:photosystem reaction center subunit H [Cyanobium sp. Prado107]
ERREREPLRQRRYLDEEDDLRGEQAYRRPASREFGDGAPERDPQRFRNEEREARGEEPRDPRDSNLRPRPRPAAPASREPLDVEADDLGDPW